MSIYRYRFLSRVVSTDCPESEGARSVGWVS